MVVLPKGKEGEGGRERLTLVMPHWSADQSRLDRRQGELLLPGAEVDWVELYPKARVRRAYWWRQWLRRK